MKSILFLGAIAICTFTSFIPKQTSLKIKDYLAVPGPVQFNSTSYKLSWSSHPAPNYYKQEYLPANEKSESFKHMLLVEAVVANLSLRDAVNTKIKELDQRKKTDAAANYQVIENPKTGEFVLDFVISEGPIVEWNAYRYIQLKDKSGKTGVLLFGYSRRAYGNETNSFLKGLSAERKKDIFTLAGYEVPKISFSE